MNKLDAIAEEIHSAFEARTTARDQALAQSRTLTRHCAHAIRAVHRDERSKAQHHLDEAKDIVLRLRNDLAPYPDIYYAGYTQDALKEYAEACIVYALVENNSLPTPDGLKISCSAYVRGLAETVGELRRRCLDILRKGYSPEAELMLQHMDDIFAVLVTMDYPDAITGGLRRLTDIARSITERTRGDLVLSMRQENLERALQSAEAQLNTQPPPPEPPH